MATLRDLPLKISTPDNWAKAALQDTIGLLNDHAHLERKAALNALELSLRWPQNKPPQKWLRVMSSVARDETAHLLLVVKLLESRGASMSRVHKSTYAQGLHKMVRKGRGPQELVDRLLISALIEARSCERFEILSRVCTDKELAKVYKSLWGSEHGHYKVFLKVAGFLDEYDVIASRWDDLLEREAELIQSQPRGEGIHGWA